MWYSSTIGAMHHLGFLEDFSRDGLFRPDDSVTRAEFVTLASHFEPLVTTGTNQFTDVPDSHWAAKYIKSGAAKGWLKGYNAGDGTMFFAPDATIIRCEVAAIICRILERQADRNYLEANEGSMPKVYTDLSSDHWAYESIMEASISHEYVREGGSERWTSVF